MILLSYLPVEWRVVTGRKRFANIYLKQYDDERLTEIVVHSFYISKRDLYSDQGDAVRVLKIHSTGKGIYM